MVNRTLFKILCLTIPVALLSLYPIDALSVHSEILNRATVYLMLHGVLALIMLALAYLGRTIGRDENLGLWLLVCGLVAVWVPLWAQPFTTHDLQRYLWDGHLFFEGLDPYRLRPDDISLASIRALWPVAPEHGAYPTLYPPLALLLFGSATVLGPSLILWKAMVSLALSALLIIVYRFLRAQRRELALVWLAAHPLFLLEGAFAAHVDAFVGLWVALGLIWLSAKPNRAGLMFGLGVLTKLSPIVLVLALAATFRRGWRILSTMLATVVIGYGTIIIAGLRPWGSTATFARDWRFGSPLGATVSEIVEPQTVPIISGLMGFMIMVLIVVNFCRQQRPSADELGWVLVLLLAAVFAASPVVFPWYLLTLLPPLVVVNSPRKDIWGALMTWTLLLPLSHEVLIIFDRENLWQPSRWPLVVVVVGVAATFMGVRKYMHSDRGVA